MGDIEDLRVQLSEARRAPPKDEPRDHRLEPPEISDMFVAGLELRDSVALEREIAAHPEIAPAEWWARIEAWECVRQHGLT